MSSEISNITPYRVGYARVSSAGQNLDSQIDALEKAGCRKIFTDKMTGSRMNRHGWEQLLEHLRTGDSLVVTELSRMTRSLLDMLQTSQQLEMKILLFVCIRSGVVKQCFWINRSFTVTRHFRGSSTGSHIS